MTHNTDEIVYKYVVRNGKLFVHEGGVIINSGRKYVRFNKEGARMRYPNANEFGVVLTSGPSVWLTERDDKLAKRLFIEFEEQKLVDLREQIRIKSELINTLKGDPA